MNILYLCADPGIPVRGHKGAAIHMRAMTNAFCELGHRVSLIVPRLGAGDGSEIRAQLLEIEAGARPPSSSTDDHEQFARSVAREIHLAAKELAGRETFDFIYERYSLWSDAGARLASETGLPLVAEVNSPLLREAARYRSISDTASASRIEADVLNAASVLAVVSIPLQEYLIERGASPEKIHVIPNAVDERLFHPGVEEGGLRSRLGLEDKFVVGFVGTIRPWHDLETLALAMSRLKNNSVSPVLRDGKRGDYHLLLVGRIPDAVRQMIASHGLDQMTTCIDPIPNNEVPPFLTAMDVAVSPHPDLPDFYFSPLKLFEYLACGTATVAADVPPVAQVVTDAVNGLLFSPGNAESLAARLASLAADPALRRRLGWEGAIRVLQAHTWKDNAREIVRLIRPGHSSPQKVPAEKPVLDKKLQRSLYLATRLDLAEVFLSRTLGEEFDRITRLEIFKYLPHRRCVIGYEITGRGPADTKKALVGKVFKDERGRDHFDIQRRLWMDGFSTGAGDHITVAEPLAYVREMHMLLQEHVPGLTLDRYMGRPDLEEKVKWSAAALAKFHASGIQPPKVYSLEAELVNLRGWAAELSLLRPDLSTRFEEQLVGLEDLAGNLPPGDPSPVHRDFHYGQIMFADPRITIIDLDLLALGDPAIDVANFAAHLQFLAIQFLPDPHGLDRLAAVFVEEYLRLRPVEEIGSRLVFYEAATLFRLLYVVLTRAQYKHCFEPLFEVSEQKIQLAVERL